MDDYIDCLTEAQMEIAYYRAVREVGSAEHTKQLMDCFEGHLRTLISKNLLNFAASRGEVEATGVDSDGIKVWESCGVHA